MQFNETQLSPAVLFPVWFPGFFGRKGSRVGTLQLSFRPQRGAKSLGSGAKTRNLTDIEIRGEKGINAKAKISSHIENSLIIQLSIYVIRLFSQLTSF